MNKIFILIWIKNGPCTCDKDRGEEEEERGEWVGLQQEILGHCAHWGELLQVAEQPQYHDGEYKHKQNWRKSSFTISEVECCGFDDVIKLI